MTPLFRDAPHTLATLPQTHAVYRLRPPHDPSLTYRIPVPAAWGRCRTLPAIDPELGRPELLGLFASPDDPQRERLTVSVTRLPYEVDPLAWVTARAAVGGWRIATARRLDDRGRFEVGALREDQGRVLVRRTVGVLDEARLLRVDATAGSGAWPKVADELWPCGMLFDLEAPTRRAQIEARRTFGGPLVKFSLPGSWDAKPTAPAERGGVTWLAWTEQDVQLAAVVRVDAARVGEAGVETIGDRQRRVVHGLKRRGVHLVREPVRVADDGDRGAGLDGWLGQWVAPGRAGSDALEIRFAHRDAGGISVDYLMVAPAPGTRHLDWMRCVRAFEIAISTTETEPLG